MSERVCKCCSQSKPVSSFEVDTMLRYRHVCKLCRSAKRSAALRNDAEKRKKRAENARRYNQSEAGLSVKRRAAERARETLADSYVRCVLGLKKDDAPAGLMEKKRQQMLLKRSIKELCKEIQLQQENGDVN